MHHNDAIGLDPRTDITDLFVFHGPSAPLKSVFILNVFPDAPSHGAAFDPEASYEIKIDTNGDFEADIAFHILFSPVSGGNQTARLYRATHEVARSGGPVGEALIQTAPVSFAREAISKTQGAYRFFVGLRSDPFFADPVGFQTHMQWTGEDFWAGRNVLAIVLQVPNSALGSNPRLGVWGRTSRRAHNGLNLVNQMGRPGNNVFREGADTNSTPPAQQRERFLAQYEALFKRFGYNEAEARALALQWLPDILPYDYAAPSGLPNGRHLSDDVVDAILPIMTKGKITSDLLGPHNDYLADFPYLGPPSGV